MAVLPGDLWRCENCHAWKRWNASAMSGQCRRHPPTQHDEHGRVYPHTLNDDACMEFVANAQTTEMLTGVGAGGTKR